MDFIRAVRASRKSSSKQDKDTTSISPKETATKRSSLESSITLVGEQPTVKSQEGNRGWSVYTVNGFTAVVRN